MRNGIFLAKEGRSRSVKSQLLVRLLFQELLVRIAVGGMQDTPFSSVEATGLLLNLPLPRSMSSHWKICLQGHTIRLNQWSHCLDQSEYLALQVQARDLTFSPTIVRSCWKAELTLTCNFEAKTW